MEFKLIFGEKDNKNVFVAYYEALITENHLAAPFSLYSLNDVEKLVLHAKFKGKTVVGLSNAERFIRKPSDVNALYNLLKEHEMDAVLTLHRGLLKEERPLTLTDLPLTSLFAAVADDVIAVNQDGTTEALKTRNATGNERKIS